MYCNLTKEMDFFLSRYVYMLNINEKISIIKSNVFQTPATSPPLQKKKPKKKKKKQTVPTFNLTIVCSCKVIFTCRF